MKKEIKKVNEKAKGFWGEFMAFAVKGNVIDLAIGLVIGSAFTSIVNSLVKDIITPLIGALTGGLNYSEWFVALDGMTYATQAEALEAGAAITIASPSISESSLIVALRAKVSAS